MDLTVALTLDILISFLALLALAVGRNPNFDLICEGFVFVSLTLYGHIIPQRVSNRADTPRKLFIFFQNIFRSVDKQLILDDSGCEKLIKGCSI